jgi:hypothetical protein
MQQLQAAYAKNPDALQADIFAMQKLVQSISAIGASGKATGDDQAFFKREGQALRLTSMMAATFGGGFSMLLSGAFKWRQPARVACSAVSVAICMYPVHATSERTTAAKALQLDTPLGHHARSIFFKHSPDSPYMQLVGVTMDAQPLSGEEYAFLASDSGAADAYGAPASAVVADALDSYAFVSDGVGASIDLDGTEGDRELRRRSASRRGGATTRREGRGGGDGEPGRGAAWSAGGGGTWSDAELAPFDPIVPFEEVERYEEIEPLPAYGSGEGEGGDYADAWGSSGGGVDHNLERRDDGDGGASDAWQSSTAGGGSAFRGNGARAGGGITATATGRRAARQTAAARARGRRFAKRAARAARRGAVARWSAVARRGRCAATAERSRARGQTFERSGRADREREASSSPRVLPSPCS